MGDDSKDNGGIKQFRKGHTKEGKGRGHVPPFSKMSLKPTARSEADAA